MKKADLHLNGKKYELPVLEGTENEVALDISSLRSQSGCITLDNGLVNTGSCTSGITFLNGEKGILRYRGYPIEQLAQNTDFLQITCLLMDGEFPHKKRLDQFKSYMKSHGSLPKEIENLVDSFSLDAHPMGVLAAGTVALSALYPHCLRRDLSDQQKDDLSAQLMMQLKIMAARFYRRKQKLSPVESKPHLDFCSDFINMMFYSKGHKTDPLLAESLNTLLILHADHEQNCSTSTVRTVASSGANIFACISAGINALWGPLHGGANQAVLEMLRKIQKNGGDGKKYILKAKDKDDPFLLMGFGHRVYKNFDPRAKIIKKVCDSLLSKLGVHDPLLDIAKELEQAALEDSYFIERNLYPNVDFYSGIIYQALGIPVDMFTVMFSLGRLPGWLAQWKELLDSSDFRIVRPRQIYVGPTRRDYIPDS